MVLTGYPLLALLIVFAAVTPFLLMGLSQLVQVKYPSALKSTVYESGMDAMGSSQIQFDMKFYMFALLFILFDIESVVFVSVGCGVYRTGRQLRLVCDC